MEAWTITIKGFLNAQMFEKCAEVILMIPLDVIHFYRLYFRFLNMAFIGIILLKL